MQTGHLASSHSLMFSSDSEGIFGKDRFGRLELHLSGDALNLSEDTDLSLLSFVMLDLARRLSQKSLKVVASPEAQSRI